MYCSQLEESNWKVIPVRTSSGLSVRMSVAHWGGRISHFLLVRRKKNATHLDRYVSKFINCVRGKRLSVCEAFYLSIRENNIALQGRSRLLWGRDPVQQRCSGGGGGPRHRAAADILLPEITAAGWKRGYPLPLRSRNSGIKCSSLAGYEMLPMALHVHQTQVVTNVDGLWEITSRLQPSGSWYCFFYYKHCGWVGYFKTVERGSVCNLIRLKPPCENLEIFNLSKCFTKLD